MKNISNAITAIPYLPEALWLHEVIGPVIFDFSLMETNLKVKHLLKEVKKVICPAQFEKTHYGTVQMLVRKWAQEMEASNGAIFKDSGLWRTALKISNEKKDTSALVNIQIWFSQTDPR